MPGPAYRVVTDRLVLRCWEPKDAPQLKAAVDASLDHLAHMPWRKHEPEPLDGKIERLRRYRGLFDLGQDFVYGIFDRDERAVLGSSGLHTRPEGAAREIGYWIHVAHAGRGLATEAAGALTRVGFEIERLQRIDILCAPDNVASAQVARKLGYTHEATLRGRSPDGDGKLRDMMLWTLLADAYAQSPAARIRLQAFDAAGRAM